MNKTSVSRSQVKSIHNQQLEPVNMYEEGPKTMTFSFGQSEDMIDEDKIDEDKIDEGKEEEMRERDRKLGYILELIQKYECYCESKQYQSTTDLIQQNGGSFYSTSIEHHQRIILSPYKQINLSSNSTRNQNTYHHHSVDSHLKTQLQSTHQQLLNKYLTPFTNTQSHSNQTITNSSNSLSSQQSISQFSNSPIFQQISFRIVNQNSFPLVQSILLNDLSSQLEPSHNQQLKTQSSQERIQQQQIESKRDDELRVRHILVFCLIMLSLFMWKM